MKLNLPLNLILAIAIIFCSTVAYGQDTSKNSYTIFRPVPRDKMRKEMETDRPNVTETPHTVDAGHFQYEADLFKHSRELTEETKQRTSYYNRTNLKVGLLANTALQVIVESYTRQKSQELSSGEKELRSGFGDITVRIKQNIYGNYKGNFSVALMPYVKFPTNKYSDQQKYEGGLIVPMLLYLPKDWKIGMQVEGDYLNDDDAPARHTEMLHSVTISHVFFDKLEIFGESYYTYNFKQHHIQNFLDAAIEYELFHDVKIDAGINYGLQKTAHKDYFVGLAVRY